jgi:hypothetical protein
MVYMGGYNGGGAMPSFSRGSMRSKEDIAPSRRSDDDPHLRSIAEVVGYRIQADDGEIGHLEDLLLEEADWSIHFLVVDTKNWWPGKKVLVSPRSVAEIDWTDHLVNIIHGERLQAWLHDFFPDANVSCVLGKFGGGISAIRLRS